MEIRNKLNLVKEKHGLSNQKWADLSGVPVGTISGILSGQTSAPGFEAVCAMLTSVGESVDEFCGAQPRAAASTDDKPVQIAEHHHHFSFLPLRGDLKELAREAISDVYASAEHKSRQMDTWMWRLLALAETALIIGVLIFDITHPTMGYIQYDVAAVSNAAIDTLRRMV